MKNEQIKIEGTHCPACKILIEKVAKKIPGIQTATLDLTLGSLSLIHDGTLDLNFLKEEIEDLGDYKVSLS